MTEVSSHSYAEFMRFYVLQARLLDEGDAAGWALTFGRDAVFRSPGRPAPVTGRASIQDAVGPMVADLASGQVARRHWVGMLEVEPQPDGSVRTVSYSQVVQTPRGGTPALARAGTCADTLVREDGRWVVADRTVTRDDRR